MRLVNCLFKDYRIYKLFEIFYIKKEIPIWAKILGYWLNSLSSIRVSKYYASVQIEQNSFGWRGGCPRYADCPESRSGAKAEVTGRMRAVFLELRRQGPTLRNTLVTWGTTPHPEHTHSCSNTFVKFCLFSFPIFPLNKSFSKSLRSCLISSLWMPVTTPESWSCRVRWLKACIWKTSDRARETGSTSERPASRGAQYSKHLAWIKTVSLATTLLCSYDFISLL